MKKGRVGRAGLDVEETKEEEVSKSNSTKRKKKKRKRSWRRYVGRGG